MIDLRFRELPSQLECGGSFYELDTDFRTWIEFERCLREDGRIWGGIFKDRIPPSPEWVEAAIEFLLSENATPRQTGSEGVRAVDYVLDGDYIVAAFQQAYGIDLTSCEYMHWHRFKALFTGLPDETRMAKIMGYRTWTKSDRKFEDEMRENRARWALPEGEEQSESDEVLQFVEEFFG